ncbi:MAG TPA: NUDIX hydrolase [Xanthobacteraceae bacterium]|nr:NUDIX hydrolase [Xanthobacteraceae bacterium]
MSNNDNVEGMVAPGTAADRAERLTNTIRDQSFANIKPRDSATLILIDRSASVPKVLLGRRHARHRFLPGKFVFPGGRVERTDRLMPVSAPLRKSDAQRLMQRVKRPSAAKAAGFALAAIRETYEETGLMLGTKASGRVAAPAGPWQAFATAGVIPDLSRIHFVARAITPPRRPRRFDSRFFAAEISAVAHRAEGFVGPDAELVELVWMPITEARQLDIPGITAIVLEELHDRIGAGIGGDYPVPLYRMLHKRFAREIL